MGDIPTDSSNLMKKNIFLSQMQQIYFKNLAESHITLGQSHTLVWACHYTFLPAPNVSSENTQFVRNFS